MINKVKKLNLHHYLGRGLVIVLFLVQAISITLHISYPSISESLNLIFFAGEKSISELLEALFWLFALIVYSRLFIDSIKIKNNHIISLWYLFFSLFCLIALGEETSWGGHLFGVSPFDFLRSINDQNESNFHNINLAQILNIPENHYLYYYLKNIAHLLNPIFYILFVYFWLVLPILKLKNRSRHCTIIQLLPIPSNKTISFFLLAIMAYLLVDKLCFDIGEIFELVLSIVAFTAAIDMWPADSFPDSA